MKYILSSLLIFIIIETQAQKEDYRWMLGTPDGSPYNAPKFGGFDLDFNNSYVKIIINHKPFYMNSHNASICNKEGRILFYTDGCFLVDADNQKIPGADTLNSIYDYFENCSHEGLLFPIGLDIPQGGLIIPKPGYLNRYLYFSLETFLGRTFAFSPHVLCTELEYRKDSLVSFVVYYKNKPICKDTFPVGSMISISKKSGSGYWIIIRKDRSNIFYTIDVSKDSIQYRNTTIGEYYQYGNLGVASFSPDGSKYAFYSQKYGLEIMDFNRESGNLSNYQKISVFDTLQGGGTGGVCFSPDSRFLYVSTRVDLYQYDITQANIKATEIFIDKTNEFICDEVLNKKSGFGPMVLGPDCRIYMVSNYVQACMNVIMNPNRKGTNCDFIQQGIKLPYYNHSSIPNFPHYRIDEPYPCDSTIKFLSTQIDEFDFSSSLIYYPNPVSDQLTILFPQPLEVESYLSLYDITGSMIKFEKIINRSTELKIDCNQLSSGIYFFQIKSINGAYAGGKFVVE